MAVKAHEKALRTSMESHYFKHNRKAWLPGFLVALVSVIAMTVLAPTQDPALGPLLAFFAMFWNGFVGLFVWSIYKGWKQVSGLATVPMVQFGFVVPLSLMTLPSVAEEARLG